MLVVIPFLRTLYFVIFMAGLLAAVTLSCLLASRRKIYHHHHHHFICSNNVKTSTLQTVQSYSLWARHTRLIRALTVALSLHLIYKDTTVSFVYKIYTTVKTKTS